MILIITGIILILAGHVLWYFLVNEDTRDNKCIFFGERFLRRLPFSRPNRKESENAQAGKNF